MGCFGELQLVPYFCKGRIDPTKRLMLALWLVDSADKKKNPKNVRSLGTYAQYWPCASLQLTPSQDHRDDISKLSKKTIRMNKIVIIVVYLRMLAVRNRVMSIKHTLTFLVAQTPWM